MKYWNQKGQFQSQAEELQQLIPAMGQVKNPAKNKALERFRKVQNAYYRLFNDGDSNGRLLGVYTYDIPRDDWMSQDLRESIWERLGKVADKALEEALVAAYAEQFNTALYDVEEV